MTDTVTVRIVVAALALITLGGMAGEALLIMQALNAPADRVKDAALLLAAFTSLPTTALGALSAVLVSTRSGSSEPAHDRPGA